MTEEVIDLYSVKRARILAFVGCRVGGATTGDIVQALPGIAQEAVDIIESLNHDGLTHWKGEEGRLYLTDEGNRHFNEVRSALGH